VEEALLQGPNDGACIKSALQIPCPALERSGLALPLHSERAQKPKSRKTRNGITHSSNSVVDESRKNNSTKQHATTSKPEGQNIYKIIAELFAL
jgi:hypothetical protein